MSNFSYIKHIDITGLCGGEHINWSVTKGVNILAGINGSGKSTILQSLSNLLKNEKFTFNDHKPITSIEVTFEDNRKLDSSTAHHKCENIDIVSTFDNSSLLLDAMVKLTDNKVRSELDWQLFNIEQRFMRYQISLGKRAIEMITTGGDKTTLSSLMNDKNRYYEIIDSLFVSSGKHIVRELDELILSNGKTNIPAYRLSSGEKQMLIILTMALTQNRNPYIMIMDEPDISLHFEWQKRLISDIMELNPNLQLIISTHSPAMVIDGWTDRISDIYDLTQQQNDHS